MKIEFCRIAFKMKKHLFAAMSVALVETKAEDARGLFEESAAALSRSGMHSFRKDPVNA